MGQEAPADVTVEVGPLLVSGLCGVSYLKLLGGSGLVTATLCLVFILANLAHQAFLCIQLQTRIKIKNLMYYVEISHGMLHCTLGDLSEIQIRMSVCCAD